MTDKELGEYGELLAQQHLKEQQYTILSTNYRYQKFEVDIIAEKENKLIVVEVKTRQTAEIGEPWKAVTKKKQKQIILCADYYVQSRNIHKNVRFDIVSIVHNQYRTELEHIVDAFST
jgi:putative endonuclease